MSQPQPRSGTSLAILLLAAIMALVGLYSIYFALNAPDQTGQLLFTTISVLAFTFVLLSFTRMRRGVRLGQYAPPKVLSIVKCGQCSFKQIKNFAAGDFVFKTLGKCTQCNSGDLSISGIYTEGPPKK